MFSHLFPQLCGSGNNRNSANARNQAIKALDKRRLNNASSLFEELNNDECEYEKGIYEFSYYLMNIISQTKVKISCIVHAMNTFDKQRNFHVRGIGGFFAAKGPTSPKTSWFAMLREKYWAKSH